MSFWTFLTVCVILGLYDWKFLEISRSILIALWNFTHDEIIWHNRCLWQISGLVKKCTYLFKIKKMIHPLPPPWKCWFCANAPWSFPCRSRSALSPCTFICRKISAILHIFLVQRYQGSKTSPKKKHKYMSRGSPWQLTLWHRHRRGRWRSRSFFPLPR